MATRFCGICGTEIDENAAFCPSCGNPLNGPEQLAEEIPPAPSWPEPQRAAEAEPDHEPARPADAPANEPDQVRTSEAGDGNSHADEPAPEPQPSAPPGSATVPPPTPPPADARPADARPATVTPAAGARPTGAQVELPFTWPVTLSGWLIGVGSLVGALSLLLDFRTFVNPVTLIAFLLLLAVAASVFLASNLPDIPNRRLWVLVVVIVAFGIALDRVGFGTSFAGVVYFLGTLAAAIGAVILELGRDRPMGGPVG